MGKLDKLPFGDQFRVWQFELRDPDCLLPPYPHLGNPVLAAARSRVAEAMPLWREPDTSLMTSLTSGPEAVDDVATTDEDTPLTINVLDNDTLPAGGVQIIDVTGQNVSIDAGEQSVTYFPNVFLQSLAAGKAKCSLSLTRSRISTGPPPPLRST